MRASDRVVNRAELTVISGQLRAVMNELHDRGTDEISLPDLLARLRVGPLQRPASEYVHVPLTSERAASDVLRMLQRGRRGQAGPPPWTPSWLSYSPMLEHRLVQRAWAQTLCRIGVHLFDQVCSLERGAYLHCDGCGCEIAVTDASDAER
jgi:hypothetical protein